MTTFEPLSGPMRDDFATRENKNPTGSVTLVARDEMQRVHSPLVWIGSIVKPYSPGKVLQTRHNRVRWGLKESFQLKFSRLSISVNYHPSGMLWRPCRLSPLKLLEERARIVAIPGDCQQRRKSGIPLWWLRETPRQTGQPVQMHDCTFSFTSNWLEFHLETKFSEEFSREREFYRSTQLLWLSRTKLVKNWEKPFLLSHENCKQRRLHVLSLWMGGCVGGWWKIGYWDENFYGKRNCQQVIHLLMKLEAKHICGSFNGFGQFTVRCSFNRLCKSICFKGNRSKMNVMVTDGNV